MILMNLLTKQKETHRLREQNYGCRWGGTIREFGMDMCTLLYLKWNKQQGPAVEYMELCSMLCGSLDRRGVWGRMDTCTLPGASMRNSACGKGHEEGGSAYAKVGSSLRSSPGNSRAPTPKTRVCLLSALCFHLHLRLYGGLSPTISLLKKS